MATITTINATDHPADSRTVINDNFNALNTAKIEDKPEQFSVSNLDGTAVVFWRGGSFPLFSAYTDSAQGSPTLAFATYSGVADPPAGFVADILSMNRTNSEINIPRTSSVLSFCTPGDVGIARAAAGLLEINNGAKGTVADLSVKNLHTTLTTPASSSAAGTAGMIVADANYIYVCTATNTWKRVALSAF